MGLKHITTDNFEKEVMKSKVPVVIDFFADWCGPCKMMGPVFEELSREYKGKAEFLKLNTEEEHKLAENFKIMGIPTIIVLSKGKEVDRIVGFLPKHMLKRNIEETLSKIKK